MRRTVVEPQEASYLQEALNEFVVQEVSTDKRQQNPPSTDEVRDIIHLLSSDDTAVTDEEIEMLQEFDSNHPGCIERIIKLLDFAIVDRIEAFQLPKEGRIRRPSEKVRQQEKRPTYNRFAITAHAVRVAYRRTT